MKLSVNLVGHGRYWLAGEEVDESIVPPELRKYAIVEGSEGKSNAGGDPEERARTSAPKTGSKLRKRP